MKSNYVIVVRLQHFMIRKRLCKYYCHSYSFLVGGAGGFSIFGTPISNRFKYPKTTNAGITMQYHKSQYQLSKIIEASRGDSMNININNTVNTTTIANKMLPNNFFIMLLV